LNNLAAVVANKAEFQPFLVNGRPLKAINQYYNKRKASLQSALPKNKKWSRQLDALTHKRSQQVKNYLHQSSRYIIDSLVAAGIGKLVIGYNEGWKQEIELGKVNNQNFTNIPHGNLAHMLASKAKLAGIEVVFTEDFYTSKCSFLDLDPVEKHDTYQGKRVFRGLFRSGASLFINADLNGAYNIIRKVFGDNCFQFDSIVAAQLQPVKVLPLRVRRFTKLGSKAFVR
jgi:putative transposase